MQPELQRSFSSEKPWIRTGQWTKGPLRATYGGGGGGGGGRKRCQQLGTKRPGQVPEQGSSR